MAEKFDFLVLAVFDVMREAVFFGFEGLLNMGIIEGGGVEDVGVGEASVRCDGFGLGYRLHAG